MRRMVVEPHADDGVLGCGGLLARFRGECQLVTVCQPDRERQNEQARALELLDPVVSIQLSIPDGQADADAVLLTSKLDWLLAMERPEELYLPYPGTHQDHVAVYEACMRAARLSMQPRHWMPPQVFVYEVPVYDLSLYPTDLRWNVFQVLDEADVSAKAHAVMAYESQVPSGPHPASELEIWSHARAVGSARGVEFAEQYAAVRIVRR